MSKKITLAVFVFMTMTTILFSCKKDSTPTPNNTSGFTWTYGGTSYTADSAYMIQGSGLAGISAYLGNPTSSSYKYFEINLMGQAAPGAYTQNGNDLIYWLANTPNQATPFTVNITALGSGKVSGNFTGTLPAGTISGSFTNIPVR